jgi:hypothetical protein
MSDMSSIGINWQMLTDTRPANRIEESFYNKKGFLRIKIQITFHLSRLIKLERLKLATIKKEVDDFFKNGRKDPDIEVSRKTGLKVRRVSFC